VPHWDNAEGGTHDTSHCWVGTRRFEYLRALLPPGTVVLGVDEHTAALLDPERGRLEVAGRGTVTVIGPAGSTVLGPGDTAPLALLEERARPGEIPGPPPSPQAIPEVAGFQEAFERALSAGNHNRALDTILSLEDAHEAWAEGEASRAHAALRGMVTRVTAAMAGLTLAPSARAAAVETLLGVRERARQRGRWEDADAIRRALLLLAVEVRDTPGGTVWETVAP